MSDKFILKLNNGDTAVLHMPSGDWVPVAELGLCTLWRASKAESERDAALDREMKLEARVAELERERDESARDAQDRIGIGKRLYESILKAVAPHFPKDSRELEWDVLPRTLGGLAADAARLREALEALVEYERKRHPPKMGGDHLPPTLREVMDIARAALASAPSAAAVVAKAVGT